jgi:hypothetical protein
MRLHRRQRDVSVETSGPHGFAVRFIAHSSDARQTSTASHANVRDDRETPLMAGTGRTKKCP